MSIFRITGTPTQRALVESALAACSFPFDLLAASLAAIGKTTLDVEWADLSRYLATGADHAAEHSHAHGAHTVERVIEGRLAVLGLFYLPPHTRIVLDRRLEQEPDLAREVFLAEAAHLVDYHWMRPEHRRQVVNMLHAQDLPPDHPVDDGVAFTLDGHVCSWFDVGPYEDWVGEAFMETFIEAFAPSVTVTITLDHPTWPPVPERVRAALLDGVVFASATGRTFHDRHAGIRPVRWFAESWRARDAGLRPCPTCRPL